MIAKTCNDLCKTVVIFLRAIVLRLCELLDIAVLPEGCRVIPAGHFNFDPALALERGGRDGVAQAIIHEKIIGWLLHYQKQGRDYVYNNIDQWAEQLPFWHKGTVRKHIHELVECGYLDRERPRIDAPSYYKQPVTKDSDGANQMVLWGEEKSLTVATKADHLQDITFTTHKPSMDKQSLTTPTLARTKPLNVGVVATFPPPTKNRDLPEKRPSTPELRETATEGDASMQASAIEGTPAPSEASQTPSISATPPPVSEEISLIFHASTPDDLARIGEARLRHELAYVEAFNRTATAKTRIVNPAGFALSQIRKYPNRETPLQVEKQVGYLGPWCVNYEPPDEVDISDDATEPDNVGEGAVMA